MKPWSQSQFEATRVIDDEGNHVCDTYDTEDAHLIAAAPCLLEALEGLYNAITDVRTTMEDLGHAEEAAAAAIAKAKP